MYTDIFDFFDPTKKAGVIRLSDNANIPADPENIDYQAYLLWLSQQSNDSSDTVE